MPRKRQSEPTTRRSYDDDFKAKAVQMLLDGHSASVDCRSAGHLGNEPALSLEAAGPVGETLNYRVQELEAELRRVERERDVLKKLWLFSADKSNRDLSSCSWCHRIGYGI